MPAAGGALAQVTDDAEPVGGGFLPTSDELLLATDTGGNERLQLYRCDADGGNRTGLVVDPEHIHRPGGVSRDGRLLAYATNRGNGTDFDVWVRSLEDGTERAVFAPADGAVPVASPPTPVSSPSRG